MESVVGVALEKRVFNNKISLCLQANMDLGGQRPRFSMAIPTTYPTFLSRIFNRIQIYQKKFYLNPLSLFQKQSGRILFDTL